MPAVSTDLARGRAQSRAPESPTDLGRHSWLMAGKRAVLGFNADRLGDWAAALTYYSVLAIFPALLALVSLLGVIGSSATQPLLDNLATATPGPARDIVTGAIQNLQNSRGTAGVLFIAGLAGAIWSASGYVAGFMRASNSIYGVEETRSFWKTLLVRLTTTMILLVLVAAVAVAVTFTGGLARQVGDLLGVGSSAVAVWDLAKWPVLALLLILVIAILDWAAPSADHPGFRWVSPGAVASVLVWVLASALFAVYIANFASYNKTYGTLGGVIAFLVWLWISNVVILLGAKLNAELERGRRAEASSA